MELLVGDEQRGFCPVASGFGLFFLLESRDMVIYLKKGGKCAVGRRPYNIDYYIYNLYIYI